MAQRDMRVRMLVWLFATPHKVVIVQVMRVMDMGMGMGVAQRLMPVRMLMAFRQMQPDAEGHQGPGNKQRHSHGFAQRQRDACTEERRH